MNKNNLKKKIRKTANKMSKQKGLNIHKALKQSERYHRRYHKDGKKIRRKNK